MTHPRVSFAIPVFNEEAVLPELVRRVGVVMDALPGGPHEAVLVDDGSMDGTARLMEAAAEADGRFVAISLSRNFGHQAAINAAIDHARGDVVIVMDGDLQDPPEAAEQLLARHAEGFDVVYAVRMDRKEGLLLRASYYLFYRLIRSLSSIDLPLDSGDFGLLSRRVVEALKSAPERQRYLRGLRSWVGFRQSPLPIARASRGAGDSKYSTLKLLKLACDGIFAFSTMPLRAASLLGFLSIACALLFAVYSLFAKFVLGDAPKGFTALIFAVIFFAGVQLLFLGIIGEYVGRVYEEVKGRPLYIVGKLTRRDGP